MEIKRCIKCNNEASPEQEVCQYCGSTEFYFSNDNNKKANNKRTTLFFTIIALILICGFIYIIVSGITAPNDHKSKDTASTEVNEGNIEVLKTKSEVTVISKDALTIEKDPMVMPDGSVIPALPDRYIILDLEIKNVSDEPMHSLSGSLKISTDYSSISVFCIFEDLDLEPGESTVIEDYSCQPLASSGDYILIHQTDFDQLSFEFNELTANAGEE